MSERRGKQMTETRPHWRRLSGEAGKPAGFLMNNLCGQLKQNNVKIAEV
jgi:hypothetical protein